jgi:hypothetical protein
MAYATMFVSVNSRALMKLCPVERGAVVKPPVLVQYRQRPFPAGLLFGFQVCLKPFREVQNFRFRKPPAVPGDCY